MSDRVVVLTVDQPVHPYLLKVRRGSQLVAYAVRDLYGWAVVGKRDGALQVVDRFDPSGPGESEVELRAACAVGLLRLATTGSTGEGFEDLPWQQPRGRSKLCALNESDGFSCDWGGCDDEAVLARFDAVEGWLPVCGYHAYTRPLTSVPPSAPARTPATGSGAVEADPGQGPGGRRSDEYPRQAGDHTNESTKGSTK